MKASVVRMAVPANIQAVWKRLALNWSLELTPRMATRIEQKFSITQGSAPRGVDDALVAGMGSPPAGTRVYVTALPGSPLADNAALCSRLRAAGMKPIPHIAARDIQDMADLEMRIETLAAATGGGECLVIAGSGSKPVGCFSDSMQVIQTGLLQKHGFNRVGVAGHPEGVSGIDDSILDRALQWKNEYSQTEGLDMYIMTQLVFDTAPIIKWLNRTSAKGSQIENRLPVYIGVAGPASVSQLLKYATLLGVGPSMQLLSNYSSKVGNLLAQATPEQLLDQLAREMASDQAGHDPTAASLIQGIHFYCFGSAASATQCFRKLCQKHGVEM